MSKLFCFSSLLLGVVFACDAAGYAQDRGRSVSASDACLVYSRGLSLGAPLVHTRTKLQAGKPLTVVATTGFPAE